MILNKCSPKEENKMVDALLKNQAILQKSQNREVLCPRCNEPFVFGLKDNFHEFSIGLTTILEYLAIAEYYSYVPEFPDEWWISATKRYETLSTIRNNLDQTE